MVPVAGCGEKDAACAQGCGETVAHCQKTLRGMPGEELGGPLSRVQAKGARAGKRKHLR